MGVPNPPFGILRRRENIHHISGTRRTNQIVLFVGSYEGDLPRSKSSSCKTSTAKTCADDPLIASGQSTVYTHTPMTMADDPPVPQTCLPWFGNKGNPEDTPGTKGAAKRLVGRWCSNAIAAITYLATFPVMWHLSAPAYLLKKAGAKYSFWPPGRERPDH
ncbi:hypothetical protein EI94DRAFT_127893 [Lactarius quietus]|nr:hypothetical protein EI94DRAFT_127893 [Lactarius quietus]